MEKKDGKNYAVLKFFETLILITLIGSALMIVLETFFDQLNEAYEEDEEYYTEDYSYDDYYYDSDYN